MNPPFVIARNVSILSAAFIGAWSVSAARGQFQALQLPGDTTYSSQVFAIRNGALGGISLSSQHPGTWLTQTSSFEDFGQASPVATGEMRAMSGIHQFGKWAGHAAMWTGTAASLVDLNPPGTNSSSILAADGNTQVGYSVIDATGGFRNATLWTGTAGSAINLQPPGMSESTAFAVSGSRQGGRVFYQGGPIHAALWSGTAASFVDMNPQGINLSTILGMWGEEQVGSVASSFGTHAAVWTGTPESWRDLQPYPIGGSELLGTCGSAQVGWANGGAGVNAGIWFGTPQSFINLAPLLPPGAGTSVATCVEEINGVFSVGGYALYGSTYRAFVWTGVPAPSPAAALFAGGLWASRRRRFR